MLITPFLCYPKLLPLPQNFQAMAKARINYFNMTKDIMNAAEAANYLSMTKGLLYKLTSTHRIPYYKPMGKRIFFKASELDEWVNAGRVPTDRELKEKGGKA